MTIPTTNQVMLARARVYADELWENLFREASEEVEELVDAFEGLIAILNEELRIANLRVEAWRKNDPE